jgi:RHS repeat-associated protein
MPQNYMKSMSRLALLLCLVFSSDLFGQTVESVLNGLQHRRKVLVMRELVSSMLFRELSARSNGEEVDYSGLQFNLQKLIKWPGEDDVFLQEGTVRTLEQTLKLLNAAAREYDKIRGAFLESGNPEGGPNARYVSDGEGAELRPGHLWSTPVGEFDEHNWRGKLLLLASNIDQLKHLNWPLAGVHGTAGIPGPYSDSPNDLSTVIWDTSTTPRLWQEEEFQYPHVLKPRNRATRTPDTPNQGYYSMGLITPIFPPMFSADDGAPLSIVRYDWSGGAGYRGPLDENDPNRPPAYASGSFESGVSAAIVLKSRTWPHSDDIGPTKIVIPESVTKTTGKLRLLRAMGVQRHGSLLEPMLKAHPDLGKAPSDILFQGDEVLQIGSYNVLHNRLGKLLNTDGSLVEEWHTGDQVTGSLGFWELPAVTFGKEWAAAPPSPQDQPRDGVGQSTVFKFTGEHALQNRIKYVQHHDNSLEPLPYVNTSYNYSATAFLVASFDFTPIVSASAKRIGGLAGGLGEVTWNATNQPVHIYAGRGLDDLNQHCFLAMERDGFGAITFLGAPDAFEVITESNYLNFTDTPHGGKTYDSTVSSIDEEKTGFATRVEYFFRWMSPRLRQVRTHDVLVDVVYAGPYSRELKFYWADALPARGAKYYENLGVPFKVVRIESPAQNGIPTERWRLIVSEGTGNGFERVSTFKQSTQQAGGLLTEIIEIKSGPDLNNLPIGTKWTSKRIGDVVEFTRESEEAGIKQTVKEKYHESFAPRATLFPILLERTVPDPGALESNRKTSFTWEQPYPYLRADFVLKTIEKTGPPSWNENGSKWIFSNKRLSQYERKYGGALWRTTSSLSGNVLQLEDSVEKGATGMQSFRSETRTYSGVTHGGLEIKVDSALVANVTTNADAGLCFPPGEQTVVFANGRRERVTIRNDGTVTGGHRHAVKSSWRAGWGANFNNEETEETTITDLGGLVAAEERTCGILVSKAVADAAHITTWGHPKKLNHLAGRSSEVTYTATGIHAGAIDKVVDAYGAATEVGTRDWRGRILETSSDLLGASSVDYSSPLKPTYQWGGNRTYKPVLNKLGEVESATGNDGGAWSQSLTGTGAVRTLSTSLPNGLSNVSDVLQGGFVAKIGAGLASRGATADFEVQDGRLVVTSSVLERTDQTGSSKLLSIQDTFDGLGRIIKRVRPSHNGDGNVTESWTYSDAIGQVLHSPAPGPVLNTVKSVTDPNTGVTTINVGGFNRFRYSRKAENGSVVALEEVYDSTWKDYLRTTVDPSTGVTKITPWALSEASRTYSEVKDPANPSKTKIAISSGTGVLLGEVTLVKGRADEVATTVSPANKEKFNWQEGYLQSQVTTLGSGPEAEVYVSSVDYAQRDVSVSGPGVNLTIDHTTEGGPMIALSDPSRHNYWHADTFDQFGDKTYRMGSGDVDWHWNWEDSLGKRIGTLTDTVGNTETVKFTLNPYSQILNKKYQSGAVTQLEETVSRHPDGTVREITIQGDEGSSVRSFGPVGNDPLKWQDNSSGLTRNWTLYPTGLPQSVNQTGFGQEEGRSFIHSRFKLQYEFHQAGPLNGSLLYVGRNGRDLPSTVLGVLGGTARSFTFGFDAVGLPNGGATITQGSISVVVERDTKGNVKKITRGGLVTEWIREPGNQRKLSAVKNTFGGFVANYNYIPDDRDRITSRVAVNRGPSWTSMVYSDRDHLTFAVISPGLGATHYNYDDRQNRINQGTKLTNVVGSLDQLNAVTRNSRGFGVVGSAAEGAEVEVISSVANTLSLTVGPDKLFSALVPVGSAPGTGPLMADVLVRATLPRPNATPAVAEQRMFLRVPALSEGMKYDYKGRLEYDAMWTYEWDGADRLISKTAKIRPPGIAAEKVEYQYDANDRRILKRHITTPSTGPPTVKTWRMLWAGWLPIGEIVEDPIRPTMKRWFQWGPDVSGTLAEAGGIGGLMAIYEEDYSGNPKRTLLPVTDGIGNVTMVVDAATGKVVAQYDFGPFGEPIGETGEADACPFRWQTKYYDAESQQYYFGYRHYDPRTGRWLSRDPLGEAGGFNLYAYCGNDPVNRHDPLGLADIYIARDADGFVIPSASARVSNGVPQVRYSDWAHWYGPIFGGERNLWWQDPSASELARLFRRTGNGWRLASEDERLGTWNQQLDVAMRQSAADAAGTVNAVAKLTYGALALGTCPWILAEGGLTWGTAAAFGHEAYAGVALLSGAVTGENYATTPEGALLRRAGAPEGAVTATDMLMPFGYMSMMGRGGRILPGPSDNLFHYRLSYDGTLTAGGFPYRLRYAGPPSPPQNPTVYSVAFEMELDPSKFGQRQERHFQIANDALEVARAADPQLAALVPAPAGWGRPPPGWTWQHATVDQGARWSNGQLVGRAGVMQLVPRSQHTPGSVWWRLFHPLPGGGGGYSEWAIPAGAPRRN